MPDSVVLPEIKLVFDQPGDDHPGGDGGGQPPPPSHGGDGPGDKRDSPPQSSTNRYFVGIKVGIISISMFFLGLAGAFLLRRAHNVDWTPIRLPALLFLNTAILLMSSVTLQLALYRLRLDNLQGFRRFWFLTTMLGAGFLAGQVVAWRLLYVQGIFLASNPASSYFYLVTGAHAIHLFGGIAALLSVMLHDSLRATVPLLTTAEVTAIYWHFMDALWIFLLAILYLGK
jgi:cytochrome c oxidase subunit 3